MRQRQSARLSQLRGGNAAQKPSTPSLRVASIKFESKKLVQIFGNIRRADRFTFAVS